MICGMLEESEFNSHRSPLTIGKDFIGMSDFFEQFRVSALVRMKSQCSVYRRIKKAQFERAAGALEMVENRETTARWLDQYNEPELCDKTGRWY